ncbi:glycosyltransferase [Kocuria soli]|nr:glycosyltransferase [Kocuria soli]
MVNVVQALAGTQPDVEVHLLDPVTVRDAPVERLRARIRGLTGGGRTLPRHTPATARRRSRALRAEYLRRRARLTASSGDTGDLQGDREVVDVMVAVAASTDVLDLPPELHLIQVTDATFHALDGFYPMFRDLGPGDRRRGRAVEHAAAQRTDRYLVASEWAARSLTKDVGVPPERIHVAPFGPGVPAVPSRSTRTDPADQREVGAAEAAGHLKVLFVSSDWVRKGGDRALAVVEAGRRRRPVVFTVVGDVPEHLPEWVTGTGRVDRGHLSELYRRHDVLLEPARANAAGVVMTDALTHGLPVLAAKVGGVESIVIDGVTGWLVTGTDGDTGSEEEAAAYVEVLTSLDRARLDAAAQAARMDASRRLTWTAWVERLSAVVHEVAVEATAPRGSAVMISPVLPSAVAQESAGELFALRLHQVIAKNRRVLTVAVDGPANGRAVARGGTPPHRLIAPHGPNGASRLWWRVAGMHPCLTPRDLETVRGLLTRAALIDLQWEEQAALLPWLRRLNPTARIVVTLHDVLSQRFERQSRLATGPLRTVAWRGRAFLARRLERQILATADEVIVLSRKDADLLPAPVHGGRTGTTARVSVVPAPVSGQPREKDRAPEGPPRLLFVGYMARWENEHAILWFAREVLPLIRQAVPEVVVSVVGEGRRDPVARELEAAGVELLGYVEDLDVQYRAASAVVVPLRLGAGVKFKVVEAMLRAVPVVTTSVGMEGVGDGSWARVADTPPEFAAEVLEVLAAPAAAEQRAQTVAREVAEVFGPEAFDVAVGRVYR